MRSSDRVPRQSAEISAFDLKVRLTDGCPASVPHHMLADVIVENAAVCKRLIPDD